ncbi:MAG: hypothetical protein PUF65_10520 [Lachnospiraceae bacterium]|nr:hypothetical protein [Lachnospiraceae bacterium]
MAHYNESIRKVNGKSIRVVTLADKGKLVEQNIISKEDAEMDERASFAVKAAVEKAKVCKKPIARYDMKTHKAYMELENGARKDGN